MRQQPEIVTERLVLRPFRAGDADDVQALAGDRRIADVTANIPHPYPDGLAEIWIASHEPMWEERSGATYAITRREDGALIGAIGLHDIRDGEGEIGYWVGVPYWNRGYCSEAAREFIVFCVTQLGLRRIHAHHLSRNPASGRVLEKAGMRRYAGGSAVCGYQKNEESVERYEFIGQAE